MVLSNEPGYYHEPTTPVVGGGGGADAKHAGFGIRIENLIVVVPAPQQSQQKAFSKFETITLVPIQTSLINVSILSVQEIEWYVRRATPSGDESVHLTCRCGVSL